MKMNPVAAVAVVAVAVEIVMGPVVAVVMQLVAINVLVDVRPAASVCIQVLQVAYKHLIT